MMQKAVEEGVRQDLIARKDLGPIPDMLVAREQDRATFVAGLHQPEEEVGLHAVQRAEANIVDDEQAVIEVAPGPQARGRRDRIDLGHVHEIIEEKVGYAAAVLDGVDAERGRQMRLAETEWAEKHHVGLVARVLTCHKQIGLTAIGIQLEAPVKAIERLAGRERVELEHGCNVPLVLALLLTGEQEIEKAERTEVLARLAQRARGAPQPDDRGRGS